MAREASIREDTAPLTPLEQAGKVVFEREKCAGCHSLSAEPLPTPGEEPWRRDPKRAPSLASEAGKYPSVWHLMHLLDPSSVSVGSTMPGFAHLQSRRSASLRDHAQASLLLEELARSALSVKKTKAGYTANGNPLPESSELLAVIAYLQRLGRRVATAQVDEAPAQPELALRLEALSRDEAARAQGREVFRSTCAPCHGAQGQGVVGPKLAGQRALRDKGVLATFDAIADGRPARGMPRWEPTLGPEAVRALTAFVFGALYLSTDTP